jgi:hypothetical protein
MPKLVVRVNVDATKDELRDLAEELARGLSERIERPLHLVGVDLQAGQVLSFAGNARDPCAFCELRGISNVDLSHNTAISAYLADVLRRRFGVPVDRYYVHFQRASKEDVGVRGRTFANLESKL